MDSILLNEHDLKRLECSFLCRTFRVQTKNRHNHSNSKSEEENNHGTTQRPNHRLHLQTLHSRTQTRLRRLRLSSRTHPPSRRQTRILRDQARHAPENQTHEWEETQKDIGGEECRFDPV